MVSQGAQSLVTIPMQARLRNSITVPLFQHRNTLCRINERGMDVVPAFDSHIGSMRSIACDYTKEGSPAVDRGVDSGVQHSCQHG